MHKLKLKTDGSVIAAIKQSILVIALLFIILPIVDMEILIKNLFFLLI